MVVVASLANFLRTSSFTGVALIIALFIISAISTCVLPSPTARWSILSTIAVPVFMNNSMSPEFAQLIVRFGECMTIGLTPLLAYFTIYISYMEKYNKAESPINLMTTLKYQIIYGVSIGVILLLLTIAWYLIGLPLGIGGSIGI